MWYECSLLYHEVNMTKLIFTVALVCAFILPAYSQASKGQDQPITATGCVEKGVVDGCLVLKDLKTHELYDLKFDKKKAAVGDAIKFDGVIRSGEVDTCQQGKIVHVGDWDKIRYHCPVAEQK